MQRPTLPDWESRNFSLGDTVEAIEKQNGQNADLVKFGNDILQYVEDSAEALLTAGGKVFPTIAAGMDAAMDNGYFYAENPDPNISKTLYQRLSATLYRKVADDPSAEFVRGAVDASTAALDLASDPRGFVADFHTDDSDEPIHRVLDKNLTVVSEVETTGRERVKTIKDFHTDDSDVAFIIINKNKQKILATDKNSNAIKDTIKDFHTDDSDYIAVWVTRKSQLLYALTEGGVTGGGINTKDLPENAQGLAPLSAYNKNLTVKISPNLDDFIYNGTREAVLGSSHLDVYALYDALMSEFPEYITRSKLGEDEWGNEILAYRCATGIKFGGTLSNPGTIPESLDAPELVWFGGVHGNEREAYISQYATLYEMCNNWRNDERLGRLRWAANIVFIPCTVPSGRDAFSRNNANGVDIARNGTWNWDLITQSTKGPSPASELETQLLENVGNIYPNAVAFIDNHNGLAWEDAGYLYWIGTGRAESFGVATESLREVEQWVRREVDYWSAQAIDDPLVRLTTDNSSAGWGRARSKLQFDDDRVCYLLETPRNTHSGPLIDLRRFNVEASIVLLNNILLKETNKRFESLTHEVI